MSLDFFIKVIFFIFQVWFPETLHEQIEMSDKKDISDNNVDNIVAFRILKVFHSILFFIVSYQLELKMHIKFLYSK